MILIGAITFGRYWVHTKSFSSCRW